MEKLPYDKLFEFYKSDLARMLESNPQKIAEKKAPYISNPIEKQKELERITLMSGFSDLQLGGFCSNQTDLYINHLKYLEEIKLSESQFKRYSSLGIFENCSSIVLIKRELQIDNYIKSIFKTSENNYKDNKTEMIYNLIDEQFKEHKGLFDCVQSDYVFRGQYNNFIFDAIEIKINEIALLPTVNTLDTLSSFIKKPFKLNMQKNAIGTLFGLLFEAGLITGSKANFTTVLVQLFEDVSINTLKENINLKGKAKDEYLKKYDILLVEHSKPLIEYLKKQKRK